MFKNPPKIYLNNAIIKRYYKIAFENKEIKNPRIEIEL